MHCIIQFILQCSAHCSEKCTALLNWPGCILKSQKCITLSIVALYSCHGTSSQKQTMLETTKLWFPAQYCIVVHCNTVKMGGASWNLLGMCRDSLRLIKLHWNALQCKLLPSYPVQCNAMQRIGKSDLQCIVGGLIYRDRGGGLITGINRSIQLPPYQVMDHLNLDLRFLQ